MKKILLITLLLLIATPLFGQSTVIVAKKKAAATCSVDTNEVGDRTDYTSCGGTCHYNVTSTAVYCIGYTADCTGTLSYAYARHYGTNADEGKVCVYSKNSAAPPDSSDLLIGCGTISSSSAELAQSASEVGGSVTATAEYWVCITGGTSDFDIIRTDSGSSTVYYISSGFNYGSPPANLDGSWSNTASRDYSMYVTIK
jgi:hypothetical protein